MIKINPMKIPGRWREGYTLSYHTLRSVFLGYDEFGHPQFDTERSEIGELLYKLKYKRDRSVVDAIVETTADFITSWNINLNFILPTPPSKSGRAYQPVLELAKSLGARLTVTLCADCVVKIKHTPELKNVYDYDQRLKLLEDAFSVNTIVIKDQNVLLFDDLYRSGATLNAITDVLYAQGEVANVYALALTRTRSTG
jgi:competence protein ComFC